MAAAVLKEGWKGRKWISKELEEKWNRMGSQEAYHYMGSAKVYSLMGYALAQAFREGITAILLILTQQAAEVVVEEISDPSVRRRCAETLEAWEQSVVAA